MENLSRRIVSACRVGTGRIGDEGRMEQGVQLLLKRWRDGVEIGCRYQFFKGERWWPGDDCMPSLSQKRHLRQMHVSRALDLALILRSAGNRGAKKSVRCEVRELSTVGMR